jgi:YD repeat-containing protein
MSRRLSALAVAALLACTAAGQVPPSKERGFKPELVYQLRDFDSVAIFNGNLTAAIPLGPTYPVGAGLSYSFVLRYSGNLWQTTEDCRYVHQPADDNSGCFNLAVPRMENGGLGWRLSFGDLREPTVDPRAETAPSKWSYISPDGSEHLFWPALHNECTIGVTTNCDPKTTGVWYSRDGSYLRMKELGTYVLVEFPNGERHRFEKYGSTDWRLRYIYNTFSTVNASGMPLTNWIAFDYEASSTPNVSYDWKITDSHGREHKVAFIDSPSVSEELDLVSTVEIEGFRGSGTDRVPVTYTLDYDLYYGTGTGLPKPCSNRSDLTTSAALLKSVSLPSAETWTFGYDVPANTNTNCSDRALSGTLTSATLPTRGVIKWTYQSIGYGDTMPPSIGIKTRTAEMDTTDVERTEYKHDPTDSSMTIHRQVKVGAEWRTQTKITQQHVSAKGVDFGLPYDKEEQDADGRHLSSETYACNTATNTCTKVRETRVRYEWDYPTNCLIDYPCTQNRNRRVVEERTTFTDDGTVADVNYSDFDGLGQYRVTETDGTFSSGNVRKSEIKYNSSVGTYKLGSDGSRLAGFTMIGSAKPWVLHTYDGTVETEGTQSAHTKACFDTTTGFLKRTRRMAMATEATDDLVSVFTVAGGGFVGREEHYGGVKNAVPITSDLCAVAVSHNDHTVRIDRTYEHGALATSRYVHRTTGDMPFFSVDNVIDSATGLLYQSKDTAGNVTTFDYDTSARLQAVTPPDLLNTSYVYTPASASAKASVTIETGSGSTRIASEIQYDRLGRVWREKTLMPGGTWSVRETLYDGLGRRSSVSEPGSGAPSSAVTTFSNYDAFGRPGKITLPDGSQTTYTYSGNRLTKRTQTVATSTTAETSVSVTEELDRAGRLVEVIENADDQAAAATTTYGYDVGNRLELVTMSDGAEVPTEQKRKFNYDVRGWLSSEEHPESGVTSYEHDARGKVVKRVTPVAAVTFEYDAAERLTTVKDGDNVLKDFTYDTATGGNGKLATAVRHHRNVPGIADVTITETYTYEGKGGRLSQKKTERNNGESFTDSYGYDDFGQLQSVTYPTCDSCSAPARTVTNTFSNGLLTQVVGYTSPTSTIAYHPNGMLSQMRHLKADGTNGPLYEQTLSSNMPRTGSITVTNYCDDFKIDAQPGDKSVASGTPANVMVQASGATTYRWFRGASATPLANQTTNTLTVPVTQTTTFWVRVGNGTCTIDSRVVTVTVCDPPDATITAPASMTASASATASVPATQGATYQWSVQGGTVVSGAGTPSITFRAGCTGPVVLNVVVSAACEASASRSVTVTPVSVTVDNPPAIAQGSGTTLTANVTGTAPLTLAWSDGVTQTNVSGSASRTVTPQGTTHYNVVATDSRGCSGSDSATVTVIPPAPTHFLATATAPNAVALSWHFSGSADQFQIFRNGGLLAVTASASYVDTSAQPGSAYLYQVVALKSGTASNGNPRDLATTVMLDSIIAATTVAAAAHVVQLQTAVNAVRQLAGQSAFPFEPVSTGSLIKALNIQQLRTALDQARSALFLPAIVYKNPATPGEPLRAVDVTELQGGVK